MHNESLGCPDEKLSQLATYFSLYNLGQTSFNETGTVHGMFM